MSERRAGAGVLQKVEKRLPSAPGNFFVPSLSGQGETWRSRVGSQKDLPRTRQACSWDASTAYSSVHEWVLGDGKQDDNQISQPPGSWRNVPVLPHHSNRHKTVLDYLDKLLSPL